ncbi:hypothetical protein WJX81_000936 [Elliptochloris bilobata]|uniref:HhH-GPD domain-containing protein n=1 Tax=Elliptochloris bilobata TaxID=381761 RepID=A0AAW1RIV2_9CHLO
MQDDSVWRKLAEKKWGSATLALRKGSSTKWMAYAKHRMCLTTHPTSPLDLIQEGVTDPWQHLVCCLLCSRTTGGAVVLDTIESFLRRYTTPTAVLAASETEICCAIKSVGLQELRCKALRLMSHSFLAEDWEEPSEFFGCGRFAADSWRIFCRGGAASLGPRDVEDATLQRYLRWARTGAADTPAPKPRRNRAAPAGAAAAKRRAGRARPARNTPELRSARRC